jgi:hypothetical protein
MHMKTFKICNCFGFKNSGEVDLEDHNQLIYILGRNSSGKSSFLNALRSFTDGVILSQQKNFKNFNLIPNNWSGLITAFHLNSNDLSIDTFETNFHQLLGEIAYNTDFIAQYNLAQPIQEIDSLYTDLIAMAIMQESIIVAKSADGSYDFSLDGNWEQSVSRKGMVNKIISQYFPPGRQFHFAGVNYSFNVNADQIENLLVRQFPRTFLFNEVYSLNEVLPERLTLDTLDSDANNALLKSFITYMDRDLLSNFLRSNDPDERDGYLQSLRDKIGILIDDINRYNQDKETNERLLEIVLHEKNGLQITVKTDGKKSYHSHLSDNTKFLFAYYLLRETNNIGDDIILFDEPSNGFHPSSQTFLLNFLVSLAKRNLVVISTHSEYLIDLDKLTGARIMTTDDNNNIIVKNHIYQRAKGTGDYLALQPILDAIGLRYGQQINLRDKVIITEGITDMFYLRAFNTLVGLDIELRIAPARGDSTMLSLIPLLISQGISFKIIIDKGDIKEKIQDAYGIEDRYIYEIPIPSDFVGKMRQSGIEDLFTKNDFQTMLSTMSLSLEANYSHVSNSFYIKHGPKRLLAHNFYGKCSTFSIDNFEKETITNFSKVLDFCKEDTWFLV